MLTIIVPVFNEEEVILNTCIELFALTEELKSEKGIEVIFIDDGSTDNTNILLQQAIQNANVPVKVVVFERNYGKSAALTEGFKRAKGDVIITMDADGQDDPKEIKKLLDKFQQKKVDVICGYRKKRKDKLTKILVSKAYNWLNRIVFGLQVHDSGCGLKLYKRVILSELKLKEGQHRFILAILKYRGAKIDEVEVEHRKRGGGKSKYGIRRIPKGIKDLIELKIELRKKRKTRECKEKNKVEVKIKEVIHNSVRFVSVLE